MVKYFELEGIPDIHKKMVVTGSDFKGAMVGGSLFLKKGDDLIVEKILIEY